VRETHSCASVMFVVLVLLVNCERGTRHHPEPTTSVEVKPEMLSRQISVSSDQSSRLTLHLPRQETIELVRFEPGTFTMGGEFYCTLTEDKPYLIFPNSGPPREFMIATAFYLGMTEITQGQWLAVMGKNPSHFAGDQSLPVESITWHEAIAFCEALSEATGRAVRLPYEAEWEYACRLDSTSESDQSVQKAGLPAVLRKAWVSPNSAKQTYPVATSLPDANGVYDLHGNVAEWCQDSYTGRVGENAAFESPDDLKVRRGSHWDGSIYSSECWIRGRSPASRRDNRIGFRIVVEP
jgi:formylglycine-generating enzyme required for sulfatase activity